MSLSKDIIKKWAEQLGCTAPEAYEWRIDNMASELDSLLQKAAADALEPEPKELPDHLCNMCGKTCLLDKEDHDLGGLIDASVSGGYFSTAGNGSGALDDGDTYKFSLCEFCLDSPFTYFRIPPQMGNYIHHDGEKKFVPATLRVADDSWRKGEKKFFELCKERNEAREIEVKK